MPPSPQMLEAARNHFPNAPAAKTERESIYHDLVRANVLLQNLIRIDMHTPDDPEWHDLRAVHAAVGRAQEYLR